MTRVLRLAAQVDVEDLRATWRLLLDQPQLRQTTARIDVQGRDSRSAFTQTANLRYSSLLALLTQFALTL